jgi:drug/metabolite transporter (DMT)-like permease
LIEINGQSQVQSHELNENHARIAYYLLFSTSILWGATFILTKLLIAQIPIFWVTFIRHLIALLGFTPFISKFLKIDKKILGMALLTGGANFFALTLQTFGLRTISTGKSAFLTGLYVILIPFIGFILYRQRITKRLWLSVIVAFVGMSILIFNSGEGLDFTSSIEIGDILTIGCAVLFALQITLTEKFAPQVDVVLLSMLQLAVVSMLALVFIIGIEPQNPLGSVSSYLWSIWIILALLSTTLPFLFQNWGQRYVPATPTALIFALEPVFATIFGYLIGNEPITWALILGGGLIFLAIVIAVQRSKPNKDE